MGASSREWVSVTCPFAAWKHRTGRDRRPSMRVQIAPRAVSRWRCFSCNSGGDLVEVLVELQMLGADLPYGDLMAVARSEEEQVEFVITDPDEVATSEPFFSEEWLASFPHAWTTTGGLDYMKLRALPLDIAIECECRFDALRGRFCFPVRDFDGRLRGMQGRDVTGSAEAKYLHYADDAHRRDTRYFLGEHRVDFDRPLIVCEGPFDRARIMEVERNVVAVMGAATVLPNERLDRLKPALTLVTLFDPNEAGDVARQRVDQWARGSTIVRHVHAPEGRDPGDLTADDVRGLLQEFL